MTFSQGWWLALLAAPVLWVFWEWQKTSRRLALLLKAAVFALVVLALARPLLTVWQDKLAVAVLADRSASIPGPQRGRQRDLIRQMEQARGPHQLRLLEFDEKVRRGVGPADPLAPADDLASGAGTHLEAALRTAMAVSTPGRVQRLVLISDGKENLGSVERAVFQARERAIPIDTILLEGRRRPELLLKSVSFPARVFSGERFPIEVLVESRKTAPATVTLSAEGKTIGRSSVELKQGDSVVRVWAQLELSGSALIRGLIEAAELGDLPFEGTVSLRRPKALLLSDESPDSRRHLEQVLSMAGFEAQYASGALPPDLDPLDLIIANNQNVEAWAVREKSRLEEFVREGGGFLLVAGENNIYLEPGEGPEDDLRKMLPANLAPPRAPEGTAVVLVLDKSSSMEGKKMELARQSAAGVVQNLRPVDHVGVLVFDNSFRWAVPLRRNDHPQATRNLITSIIADGGTQIAPALGEAFAQIQLSDAVYKHILLLTDGISEEGDSIELARQASELNITISTVGLGQDVNRSYLERVARTARGKSYFLLDVSGLAQLVIRDVKEHTGSSIIEKAARAEATGRWEILDGLAIEEAGPLLGWIRFTAKPRAEFLLRVDGRDPLLTQWQYGLGRSAVFASDASDRWSVNWVGWSGFDRFWINLLRNLLPRSHAAEASARFEQSSGEIVVRYRVSGDRPAPQLLPDLYALGPGGFRQVVPLQRVSSSAYEARVRIEERLGLFRIGPATQAESFPEVAIYRPNSELADYGSNRALMQRIAQATGGRVDPQPAAVFDAEGRAVQSAMDLWPGLLALAVLLNLIELLARKGWLPWLGRWA